MKERATQAVFVTVVFSVPGSCSDGDIRLEGGSVGTSGNIQVCYTGLWGTVCDTDEDWGQAECAVSGHQRKLEEPYLLLGLEKLEGEGVGDVKKGEGRGKRRRKRERSQHRGIGGAARDEKLLRREDEEEANDTEGDGGGRDSDSEVKSVEAGITHPSHREDPLNSVSEQSKKDSVLSLRHNKSRSPSVSLSSPSLQKAPSPPQSGSALNLWVALPVGMQPLERVRAHATWTHTLSRPPTGSRV